MLSVIDRSRNTFPLPTIKSTNRTAESKTEIFPHIGAIFHFKLIPAIAAHRQRIIGEGKREQEVAIDGTVKNIEKIVIVSEQTASGTEQIASSSQELSQGMDEVSATSKDLADVANQLLDSVTKFTLSK